MSLPGKEPNTLARTPADPDGGQPEATRRSRTEESAAVRAVGFEDVAQVEVPVGLRREIERAMKKYPETRSASIPALWAVQRKYGWCTPEGIRQAAAVMGVTPAYLESVASFYDLFHLEPIGNHQVLVCTNISCWLRGGDQLLDAFKQAAQRKDPAPGKGPKPAAPGREAEEAAGTERPPDIYVTGFECLGACDIAPMASIDERYYGPLDASDAAEAVEALRKRGEEVLPGKRLEDRGAAGGKRNPADKRLAAHAGNKPKRPRPKR
ncbi:MAG: NAD(P)H-dependent oxidoreductase subunit E [Solirubrobacterales bacterium]